MGRAGGKKELGGVGRTGRFQATWTGEAACMPHDVHADKPDFNSKGKLRRSTGQLDALGGRPATAGGGGGGSPAAGHDPPHVASTGGLHSLARAAVVQPGLNAGSSPPPLPPPPPPPPASGSRSDAAPAPATRGVSSGGVSSGDGRDVGGDGRCTRGLH
eukprot:273623-Chlamydomonas_euryale.AAC.1